MAFVHGKSGKFFVGATDFKVTNFDCTWEVDTEDITHTGNSGAQVMIDGIEKANGTVTFIYDTAAKPTVAPQDLKPRTQAILHLKPDGTDDFSFTALCTRFRFKSGPKAGAVEVTVDFMSNSVISSPGA